jgi:uncharacterized protein (DUF488 family)
MQKEKSFDFIPYKFGCYSLQAIQDLSVLEKTGYIKKHQTNHATTWKMHSSDNFIAMLKPEDQSALNNLFRNFSTLRTNELIKHTYLNYPYWAIHSTILEDILTTEEQSRVLEQKKALTVKCLYTIGYEGVSLENYLNKLIINDVKVLCDVRKNALSQKWGFSKSVLKDACEKAGIRYVHIPQLGVESEDRQELKTLSDYIHLFSLYKLTTLPENKTSLLQLAEIVRQNERVALTCFEKDVQMCHRGVVASELMKIEKLHKFTRKDL